ncbi:MAG: hypothetical protein KBC00_00735 [Candidatus Levybacteria bacterium]|nr:hypothetical protein [Candidatus Levybacteria bacterium]MBP9814720.1 hypothetical protein [Candidatus Levybacteria bacterium]
MKKLILFFFLLICLYYVPPTFAAGVVFTGRDYSDVCTGQKNVQKTVKGTLVSMKDLSTVYATGDNPTACNTICTYLGTLGGKFPATIDDANLFTNTSCTDEQGNTNEDRFLDEINNPTLEDCITSESYYICKGLGATRGLEKDKKNNQPYIDESVPFVSVYFKNISNPTKNSKYFYCLKSKPEDCSDDDWNEATVSNGTIILPKLCGDGEKTLKEDCTESTNLVDGDWFHAGKTYHVYLSQGKDSKSVNPNDVKAHADFYVSHFYPEVVLPKGDEKNKLLNTDNMKKGWDFLVELKGRNIKSGKNEDIYNDYWMQIEGMDNDYRSEPKCLLVEKGADPKASTGKATIFLSPESKDSDGNVIATLTEGKYILKIKDGRDLKKNKNGITCEPNDFTLYFITFTIARGGGEGSIGTIIKDPYGKELGATIPWFPPRPLCDPVDIDKATGYCKKIPTALGIKISTEPQFFVRDIFTIVLSIGGVAAVLFFIRAGYTIMTSAGNKEKVGQAREQITAAITGLIFIILSIAILEFIGVNILRIPGLQ